MTDAQQLRFSKLLGTPRVEHGTDITMVSGDKIRSPVFAEYTEGTYFFHFDDTYMDVPALASILRARVVAPKGGQTEFANTYAIYEDLPKDEQDYLDTLYAVHSQETQMRKAYPNPTEHQLSYWGEKAIPPKTHPLVWQHRTGRKSLLLGNTISSIVGLERAESDALIRRLHELADRPEYIYRHEWQVGDVLIWDNTGTMHRVVPFDLDCGRELQRVKLAGEEPIRATQKELA
jgi:alpha-ketoglutarate-dependent taurine dioxygenase